MKVAQAILPAASPLMATRSDARRHDCLRHGICILLLASVTFAQSGLREAVSSLERGDFPAAEKTLRTELQARPNDAMCLSLLGVALDGQKRFPEAEQMHRRAAAAAPHSTDVLNNYAIHLGNEGREDAARDTYLKVIAIDPAHFNANVQLARLALKRKNGAEALTALKRLPAAAQQAPNVSILIMQSAYMAGEIAEANGLFVRLSDAARSDAAMSFAAGMALGEADQFEKAESFFETALAAAPSDFNVLANLGVAASRAGHNERAREVLETALRQQPQNVDVLYNLAFVYQSLKQTDAAVRILVQAARAAPKRADVQKLLAITTSDLGALEDSMAAWDRYLKLEPGDDFARRERGFTAVQMGKFEQGVPDLEWFVARHPGDAVGQYEMAIAQGNGDPEKILQNLTKALALNPNLVPARSARGSLYYQQGKFAESAADLEVAAKLRPSDAGIFDRLGQAYMALDRPADAVPVLRKAAELAPDDSKTQLHFARALAEAGDAKGSKAAMDRFRQLGPVVQKSVPAGLVDYLGMTPEQQHADYAARVEKAAKEKPDDVPTQVAWLQVLLDDGKLQPVPALARRITAMMPAGSVLAGAGRALAQAKQYALAKELLEAAAAATPPAEVEPDLTIAGAQLLDAGGKHEEAVAALDRIAASAPPRPEVYWQIAALLVRNGRAPAAQRLLERASDPEILVMKAMVLAIAGQGAAAKTLLDELQARRPEWYALWAARGMMLAAEKQPEAKQTLETAVALGARSPEVRGVLNGKAADLGAFFQARPPREW